MAVPKKYHEPIQITAGDTLYWCRNFSDYPASGGWSLDYELRGGAQPISFQSVANGDEHDITVASAVTALWLPAQYIMEGYAINPGTSERERIYKNNVLVSLNYQGAAPDVVVTTHAQRMLSLIEAVQEGTATHDIIESDIEQTRIKKMSRKELRDEYNYWRSIRMNEIRVLNAKSGRSNGRNRYEVFVDPAGQTIGQFGALPPIFPYGGGRPY